MWYGGIGRHSSFRSYITEGSSPSIRKLFFFNIILYGSSLIGRVSSCHGEVCGFESRLPRKNKWKVV